MWLSFKDDEEVKGSHVATSFWKLLPDFGRSLANSSKIPIEVKLMTVLQFSFTLISVGERIMYSLIKGYMKVSSVFCELFV